MKKTLASILLIAVMSTVGTVALPSRTAHADIIGVDVVWDIFSNFIWEALKANIRKRLLDMMVDDIISYIQGNGAAPRFIQNFGDYLEDAADAAVGDVIVGIGAGTLCSPFGAQVRLSIIPVPKFNERVQCTLTGIVSNIQNFYIDFSTGGWDGYMAHWLPQNNYYGATYIAKDEQERAVLKAVRAASAEATANRGFLSGEVCDVAEICTRYDEDGNCSERERQSVPRDWQPNDPAEDRCVKKKIVTPGSVVGELAAKVAGADIDRLIGLDSDDLSEYVAAITDAFINRLAAETVSGVQKGLAEARGSSGDGQTQSQRSSPDQTRNRLGGLADVFEAFGRVIGQLVGGILELVGKIFRTIGNPCFSLLGSRICLWRLGNEPQGMQDIRETAIQDLFIRRCTSEFTAKNFDACAQRMIDLKIETSNTYASSTALFDDLKAALQGIATSISMHIQQPTAVGACIAPDIVDKTEVEKDDMVETKNQEVNVLTLYQSFFDFNANITRLMQEAEAINAFQSSTVGTLPTISASVTFASVIINIEDAKLLAETDAGEVDSIAALLINASAYLNGLIDFSALPNKPDISGEIRRIQDILQYIIDDKSPTADVSTILSQIINDLQTLQDKIEDLPTTGSNIAIETISAAFDGLAALLTTDDAFIRQKDALILQANNIITALQAIVTDGLDEGIVSKINGGIDKLRIVRNSVSASASPSDFVAQKASLASQTNEIITDLETANVPPIVQEINGNIDTLRAFQDEIAKKVSPATAFPPVFAERRDSTRQYNILKEILDSDEEGASRLARAREDLLACIPPPPPPPPPEPTGGD